MTAYRFSLVCPECNNARDYESYETPKLNCGDCLMQHVKLVELKVVKVVGEHFVTVRYRTNSGCNAKSLTISAPDMETALNMGIAKVRKMRGVIKIDGGDCRLLEDK